MRKLAIIVSVCLLYGCSKEESQDNNNQNSKLHGTWLLTSIIDESNGDELVNDNCRTKNNIIFNSVNDEFDIEQYKITSGDCKLNKKYSGKFEFNGSTLTYSKNSQSIDVTVTYLSNVQLKIKEIEKEVAYTSTYKKKP